MRNDDLMLELEMNRLETLNRLEPNLTTEEGENIALLSIAISLKRIADQQDQRTPGQRVKEAHVAMVNELPRRNHFARSRSCSAMMKRWGYSFFKRTGIQSDEL